MQRVWANEGNGWEHTDLSVKLDHPLVLPIYPPASEYPVHLTES